MITCPYCQHKMPEGALFCQECGLSLLDDHDTLRLDVHSNALGRRPIWGTETLVAGQAVLLQVGDTAQSIDFQPDVDFTLGRGEGSGAGSGSDLDLTPYGGVEKGVSRRHAALRRGEGMLAVIDLDSTNGTFLNGHRLAAHQPHIVHDGDEIRLGKLSMHIYFRAE